MNISYPQAKVNHARFLIALKAGQVSFLNTAFEAHASQKTEQK